MGQPVPLSNGGPGVHHVDNEMMEEEENNEERLVIAEGATDYARGTPQGTKITKVDKR